MLLPLHLSCSREEEENPVMPTGAAPRPQRVLEVHGEAGGVTAGPLGCPSPPSTFPSFTKSSSLSQLWLTRESEPHTVKGVRGEERTFLAYWTNTMKAFTCMSSLSSTPSPPLTSWVAFCSLPTRDSMVSPESEGYSSVEVCLKRSLEVEVLRNYTVVARQPGR